MLNSIGKLGTQLQKTSPNPVLIKASPLSTGKVQQEKLTMQTFGSSDHWRQSQQTLKTKALIARWQQVKTDVARSPIQLSNCLPYPKPNPTG